LKLNELLTFFFKKCAVSSLAISLYVGFSPLGTFVVLCVAD